MANSKPKSFFELVPFFGSFLLFLGICRLISYYGEFGINIVNYLDFSEILTSFFDVFVILAFIFSITFIQGFLSASKRSEESNRKRKNIIEEKFLIKRMGMYFSYYISSFVGAIFALSFNFLVLRLFDKSLIWNDLFYYYLVTLGYYVFLIFLTEIEIRHKYFQSSDSFKFYIQVLIYSTLVVALVIYTGYRQALSVKERKIYYGTAIELEGNSRIVSDSTTYYIGNTKNYLYVYHEKDGSTDVIPMTRIKLISHRHPSNLKNY